MFFKNKLRINQHFYALNQLVFDLTHLLHFVHVDPFFFKLFGIVS